MMNAMLKPAVLQWALAVALAFSATACAKKPSTVPCDSSAKKKTGRKYVACKGDCEIMEFNCPEGQRQFEDEHGCGCVVADSAVPTD